MEDLYAEWQKKFDRVTAKINGGDKSPEVLREYQRLLNEEPDDPDGFLEEIIEKSLD